jgi:ribonuclease HI
MQEFPLERLRLADFRHSVPWLQVRSRHAQAHYSGSYASAQYCAPRPRVRTDACRPLRRIPQAAVLAGGSLRGMTGSTDGTRPGVVIWTAQSCPAAQGPGGWAFAAYSDGREAGCALGGEQSTTRPRMDLAAAAEALEALARPCALTLWSDSKYLITGMADGWLLRWERNGMRTSERNQGKPPAIMDLWDRLRLAAEGHHVTWRRIRGDTGSSRSEHAHKLAAAARQAAQDTSAPVFQVSSSSELISPRSNSTSVLTSGALISRLPDL